MPAPRQWREHLQAVWSELDAAAANAHRRKQHDIRVLVTIPIEIPDNRWLTRVGGWACPMRGLGDLARFALCRYLSIPACYDRPLRVPEDIDSAQPMDRDGWMTLIRAHDPGYATLTKACLREFDKQIGSNAPLPPEELAVVETAANDRGFWEALAAAANEYFKERKRARSQTVTGEGLRNRRFAGPTAIRDFITYLNGGAIPPWQPPCPDDLTDLGVRDPRSNEFVHEIPYFRSTRRARKIQKLAGYAAKPPDGTFRVACLYSRTEPHGLIAACNRLVERYSAVCIEKKVRRLPVVYVPVGLDIQRAHVSRREVIRDLHRKLCVGRKIAGENEEHREVPPDATGEQIDAAVSAIRTALARCPTLLIFGVHHVADDLRTRAIEEEIRDSPLPYAIDRLMPESGLFGDIIPSKDAHATLAIVLADGPLKRFSTFEVRRIRLPGCPGRSLASLLDWTGSSRVLQQYLERNQQKVASNEIELTIFESTLELAELRGNDAGGPELRERISRTFWEPRAAGAADRTPALLGVVLNYLTEQGRFDRAYAWFLTILHIVALSAGGLRRETAVRVIAGYIVATGASDEDSRPAWLKDQEAALWTFPAPGPLSADDVDALAREVVARLDAFQASARAHIRVLNSAKTPALDNYEHPFESPEVPAFSFNLEDPRNVLELRFPLVQAEICRQLRDSCEQKHALLQRLLADEFLRRAAIVQRHGTDRDQLSLVEQRYAIAAIYHGLESLAFSRDSLLSRDGRERSRWLLEPSNPQAAYYWIYRWLYIAQVNGDGDKLSRQHGAELLRIALLQGFLDAGRDPTVRWTRLRDYQIRRDILQGLCHAALLSGNQGIAAGALRSLEQLGVEMREAISGSKRAKRGRQHPWLWQFEEIQRHITMLRLEGMVMHPKRFARVKKQRWPGWKLAHLVAAAATAEPAPWMGRLSAEGMLSIMKTALIGVTESAPPYKSLNEAARTLRRRLSRAGAQYLYDYLMRYAELIAESAERRKIEKRRTARLKRALLMFELAEALRRGAAIGDESEQILDLSARPARNALRLCLSLGGATRRQETENPSMAAARAADGYFERAAYYAFHFIGHLARYQVERVAALLVEASTIRIRGATGCARNLHIALEVIKTAERALIHYPSRRRLWVLLYLERARLFRDRAIELGAHSEEAVSCAEYCKADVASVLRLAGEQPLWRNRALRVMRGLPDWVPRGGLREQDD